jgi:hypothetical protein
MKDNKDQIVKKWDSNLYDKNILMSLRTEKIY